MCIIITIIIIIIIIIIINVYIYIYIYIYMYTHTCVCIYIYIYIYLSTCGYLFVCFFLSWFRKYARAYPRYINTYVYTCYFSPSLGEPSRKSSGGRLSIHVFVVCMRCVCLHHASFYHSVPSALAYPRTQTP